MKAEPSLFQMLLPMTQEQLDKVPRHMVIGALADVELMINQKITYDEAAGMGYPLSRTVMPHPHMSMDFLLAAHMFLYDEYYVN